MNNTELKQQIKSIVKKAEIAIESGEIGQAAHLFEKGCQICEENNVEPGNEPELLRIAAGISLLQECEKEPEHPTAPQVDEAAITRLKYIEEQFG